MKQKGFTLIVSLIFLVLMTLIGLTMFKSFTTDQMIAGNLREKSRAFYAAESALNYAKFWLTQPGNATTGTTCSGMSNAPLVCNTALTSPTTLPWTTGINYTPPWMQVNAAGGTGTYAAQPTYYIQYIPAPTSTSMASYYLITAAAQGGNANSVAVLQVVYKISSTTSNAGNP